MHDGFAFPQYWAGCNSLFFFYTIRKKIIFLSIFSLLNKPMDLFDLNDIYI